MPKAKSIDQFIADARKVHGDRYDYSKVVYVNSKTKVCIICPEHGEFWQSPNPHISHNAGCPKCGRVVTSQKLSFSKEDFIRQAKAIHGEKYDYSKVDYTNNSTKVCIICPEHGEFLQTPNAHISQKCGCPDCRSKRISESKRKDTASFILKAHTIHGYRYDYSKVKYKGVFERVCIICPEHGEFWQVPNVHLDGCGCPKCANLQASIRQTKTTEQFIADAKAVHGDKYDYSKVKYVNRKEKVCIICPEHGEFCQSPGNHVNLQSVCPKCVNRYSATTSEFIENAIKVHGYKYDYSKVNYTRNKDKVCIICPEHGEFWQKPNTHVSQGCGCPKCSPSYRLNTYSFIQKAKLKHGDRYDYSLVEYIDCEHKVQIVCREHGPFWQVPSAHLAGYNCPKCSRRYMDTEYFKEVAGKLHHGKYDYSLVDYKGSQEYVTIICPTHGEFQQVACQHLTGSGCPICSESRLEKYIRHILKQNHITFVSQKRFPWLRDDKAMRLDFFLPDYGTAIECQGIQHFMAVEYFGGDEGLKERRERDRLKENLCTRHGIKMLYFSDLGITYPYPVFEDAQMLIKAIKENLSVDHLIWKDPDLPLSF